MKRALLAVGSIGTAAGAHGWPAFSGVTRATAIDRALLAPLQRALEAASIRLDLWDGTTLYRSPAAPAAIVTIHDRGMLLDLLRNRELTFGEGFSAKRLTVDGSLIEVLEAIYRTYPPRPAGWLSRLSTWRRNTLDRSRHDIHHH